MIDSNDKQNKFAASKSLWFISLFTVASCLPLVLWKTLPTPSTSGATQTPTKQIASGDRPSNLSLPSNSTDNKPNKPESIVTPATNTNSSINTVKTTPVVPKAPEVPQQSAKPTVITTNPTKPKETVNPLSTAIEKKTTATKNKATTTSATKPTTQTKTKTRTTTTTANKTKSTTPPKQTTTKSAVSPLIEVSVAIETSITSLTVGSSTKAAITDAKGRILQNISPNQGLVAKLNGNGIQIDNWQLPSIVWIQPQQGGAVYIGEKWYRGKLLLVAEGGKLLAINHVDLEHYLYSVVGSEMHPTANINALKAQAVAARSYALVHIIRPASRWYNLGDTQRWQVYKGVSTEYNTTQQAVNETNNKILSHQGGVVESLYASNEEIVNRVHGGSGMSQTGAYKLADAGYDYQQILGYYYPGVEVATLVRK